MLPRCELYNDSRHSPSYVALIATEEPAEVIDALQRFAANQRIDHNHRATAIFLQNSSLYFCVTTAEAHRSRTDNGYRHWSQVLPRIMCESGHMLKDVATVEWVRPFTTLLQRTLGLADDSGDGFPKLVEHKIHPRWPDTPFFVVSQEKVKSNQKLETMRLELGDGAGLAKFAKK